MKDKIVNISLNDLAEIENLSIRTINVCRYYSLNDIRSILEYYWKYGDFLRLRNSGRKSNLELINLCIKYAHKTEVSPDMPLIQEDKIVVNKKVAELGLIEGLSARSQNLCEYNNLKDLKSIVHYYWENKNFRNIRRCGQLSDLELVNLCKKYENLFIEAKYNQKNPE